MTTNGTREFSWEKIDQARLPKLARIDPTPDCAFRTYLTPAGNRYPSVTSILGSQDNTGLDAWRERVGQEQADKVMRQATGRGTQLHLLMEQYLRNEQVPLSNPFHADLFRQLKVEADRHITRVMAQEASLYSDTLQLAGTLDLLAHWDNELAVIDYKSSSKAKEKEWIHGYFIQCTAYAIMVEEIFGLKVKRLVVMVASEDGNKAQVFLEQSRNWIPELSRIRREFKQKHKL